MSDNYKGTICLVEVDVLHSTASLWALVTAVWIGIYCILSGVITTFVCTIRAIKRIEEIVEGSALNQEI